MQRREHFGRRTPPEDRRKVAATAPPARQIPLAGRPCLPAPSGADEDVARDIAEWQAARKTRKRSFREPWRSVSIAAAIGFGLSSWLLPDSVADIAQLVTLGLALAAFLAGFRKKEGAEPLPGRTPPAGGAPPAGRPHLPPS